MRKQRKKRGKKRKKLRKAENENSEEKVPCETAYGRKARKNGIKVNKEKERM